MAILENFSKVCTLRVPHRFEKKVCTLGYLCTLRGVYFKESVLYLISNLNFHMIGKKF